MELYFESSLKILRINYRGAKNSKDQDRRWILYWNFIFSFFFSNIVSLRIFQSRDFAFIRRINLKHPQNSLETRWQHVIQRYAVNATMIACHFSRQEIATYRCFEMAANHLDRKNWNWRSGYVGWKWKIRENIRFLRNFVDI